MTDLLEFISGLIDGFTLLALAVSIGGVAYTLIVLRTLSEINPVLEKASAHALQASFWGATGFGICRLAQLVLKPWALADATGVWAIESFLKTQVFQSTASSTVLIFVLAAILSALRQRPKNTTLWSWALIVLSAFLINEAWLTHGASRLEGGGETYVYHHFTPYRCSGMGGRCLSPYAFVVGHQKGSREGEVVANSRHSVFNDWSDIYGSYSHSRFVFRVELRW